MKDAKVIDLFSRKDMNDHQQDTSLTDVVASKGKFVGTLSEEKSKAYRLRMKHLTGRGEQIDAMAEKWQADYQEYIMEVYSELQDFGVEFEDFDPMTQDVAIDEAGKMWIVDSALVKPPKE